MNPTINKLQILGYNVKVWPAIECLPEMLQVTSSEPGPAHGMTVYLPVDCSLDTAVLALEIKRQEFKAKA